MKYIPIFAVWLLVSTVEARTVVVNPALPDALRTIQQAVELAKPGDVVRIYSGIYREKVIIKQSGTTERPIRVEAAPGAQVVVTGADQLTGWTKDTTNSYSIAWPHQLYQGDEHNPGGVEQIFVNHQLYRKVPNLADLTAGTFFVDLTGKRLHLFATRNPDDDQVEASTRAAIWIVTGAHVQTCGLRFCSAANRAQQGMAIFRGAHALVEDCVFEWSNSTGANFLAADIVVRRCVFQDNGQQGFSATRAHRLHLDGCTIQRNNVKNFPRGWEAGGDKICLTRGAVVERCRFLCNHGNGVWFDISNVDSTVRNCLIADNEDAGIFYEISYGLHAHDNVIVGNGLANTKGAWGANGGICISSSPGCRVERNLLIGNQQGFCFREQNRTTAPIAELDGKANSAEVPIWNHDEIIRDNLFVNNRTAQVQGWFDIATERHWPKALQTGKAEVGKTKNDWAAGYQAKQDGVPPGLSLEDLKIAFQGNCYAFLPEQKFFIWGANWKHKQAFPDFPALQKALGFEDQRSQMIAALPMDPDHRDFRLAGDLFKRVKHTYPQGRIPDCVLGVR